MTNINIKYLDWQLDKLASYGNRPLMKCYAVMCAEQAARLSQDSRITDCLEAIALYRNSELLLREEKITAAISGANDVAVENRHTPEGFAASTVCEAAVSVLALSMRELHLSAGITHFYAVSADEELAQILEKFLRGKLVALMGTA